jgi:nucleoside-diphosphate-sugar epimerase
LKVLLLVNSLLILGASGVLGQCLSPLLALDFQQVSGTYFENPPKSPKSLTWSPLRCDIRKYDEIIEVIKSTTPNAVLFLAADSKPRNSWLRNKNYIDVNIVGLHNTLCALNDLGVDAKFVFLSSSDVYGQSIGNRKFSEEDLPHPISPYGASKLAGEHLVRLFCERASRPFFCVRLFQTIGVLKFNDFLSDVCNQLAEGTNLKRLIVGNVNITRDFLMVEEAANGIRHLIQQEGVSGIINLGSGNGIVLQEVVHSLCEAFCPDVSVSSAKHLVRDNDTSFRVANVSRLESFGWRSELDPIDAFRYVAQLKLNNLKKG